MENLIKLAHFAIKAVKVVVDFFRANEEVVKAAADAAEQYATKSEESDVEGKEKQASKVKKAAEMFAKVVRTAAKFSKEFGDKVDDCHADISARAAA